MFSHSTAESLSGCPQRSPPKVRGVEEGRMGGVSPLCIHICCRHRMSLLVGLSLFKGFRLGNSGTCYLSSVTLVPLVSLSLQFRDIWLLSAPAQAFGARVILVGL